MPLAMAGSAKRFGPRKFNPVALSRSCRANRAEPSVTYSSGEMEVAANADPYRVVVAALMELGNVATGIETAELFRR